jgi:hypothetical protein
MVAPTPSLNYFLPNHTHVRQKYVATCIIKFESKMCGNMLVLYVLEVTLLVYSLREALKPQLIWGCRMHIV